MDRNESPNRNGHQTAARNELGLVAFVRWCIRVGVRIMNPRSLLRLMRAFLDVLRRMIAFWGERLGWTVRTLVGMPEYRFTREELEEARRIVDGLDADLRQAPHGNH